MKISKIICALLFFAFPVVCLAQSGISNPITQAAIREYNAQIKENPQNYRALMGRGGEYYQHNDYVRALSDLTEALKYVPQKDDEGSRLQIYILRADIYNQTGHPEDALRDLEEAYALAPDSYLVIYQKANTEYTLGEYAKANADYKRLRSMNPRSVESLIGQARVAVKENNLGTANELLAQAVNLDPNNPATFVDRASIRKMMGDDNGAVDDLIMAIAIDNTSSTNALNELVDYGRTNYAATIAGLTNAMTKAPSNGMYPYLRAKIAQGNFNYLAALKDYEYIIEKELYNYHGIYASIAECQYALGRYDQALESIDRAMGMVRGQIDYYALRANILRALNRPDGAKVSAEAGLMLNSNNTDCLEALALAQIDLKEYSDANTSLGEIVLNDPEKPAPLLLRAWLSETYLNAPMAAKGMIAQVSAMDIFSNLNVMSLKGFALLREGSTDEAVKWMENILASVADPTGEINYYATCFFAQAGNADRAFECMEKSLEKGYANYHNWNDLKDGWVNCAPIRDELRFLWLIHKYNVIFGR